MLVFVIGVVVLDAKNGSCGWGVRTDGFGEWERQLDERCEKPGSERINKKNGVESGRVGVVEV